MGNEILRSAWVEVDLDAIDYNVKNIAKLIGDSKPIGVMKADAYGFGLLPVAEVLRANGYEYFAVATLEEAIALRESGAQENIFVMGIILNEFAEIAVANRIMPIICSYDNAKAFSDASAKAGITTECFLAIDTGLSRIGLMSGDTDNCENSDGCEKCEISENSKNSEMSENCEIRKALLEEAKKIAELPNLRIVALHSHFAASDEADKTFCKLQLKRFLEVYDLLRSNGIEIPGRSIACSAAIIDMPETIYEYCRPGFIFYGIYPSDEVKKERLPLKPAMSVKAKIVYVKDIKKGDTVGYGRKYQATERRRIATLPLGFADGLPRAYSPNARVIVNGHFAPVTGNICMDQCMIDVTDIPDVAVGTEVILLGSDGTNTITAEEIALNTPGLDVDELLHGFSKRMPRVYTGAMAERMCKNR